MDQFELTIRTIESVLDLADRCRDEGIDLETTKRILYPFFTTYAERWPEATPMRSVEESMRGILDALGVRRLDNVLPPDNPAVDAEGK